MLRYFFCYKKKNNWKISVCWTCICRRSLVISEYNQECFSVAFRNCKFFKQHFFSVWTYTLLKSPLSFLEKKRKLPTFIFDLGKWVHSNLINKAGVFIYGQANLFWQSFTATIVFVLYIQYIHCVYIWKAQYIKQDFCDIWNIRVFLINSKAGSWNTLLIEIRMPAWQLWGSTQKISTVKNFGLGKPWNMSIRVWRMNTQVPFHAENEKHMTALVSKCYIVQIVKQIYASCDTQLTVTLI